MVTGRNSGDHQIDGERRQRELGNFRKSGVVPEDDHLTRSALVGSIWSGEVGGDG
jgi:hypothetical protein